MKLGDLEFWLLTDGTFRLDGGAMFGVIPKPMWEKVSPPDARNRILMAMNSLLIRAAGKWILVETGAGDKWDAKRSDIYAFDEPPRLPDKLVTHGVPPEKIDIVLNTHLHFDHCGWNTRLVNGRWVPTFPNAKYVFHKKEYDYWEAATARKEQPPGDVWRMNCLPVVEAGQALLVNDDYALDDNVTLTPTPGHSPCHCCVNIFSGGQRASVTGDMMHHALQCREPEWSTIFDTDPVLAAKSRRGFLNSVADTDTLILPVHFPSPTAGRIAADGERFHYRFGAG